MLYFIVGTGVYESKFVKKPTKLEEHKHKSYQNALFFLVTFTRRLPIRVLLYSCFNQLLHHSYHVVPRALACSIHLLDFLHFRNIEWFKSMKKRIRYSWVRLTQTIVPPNVHRFGFCPSLNSSLFKSIECYKHNNRHCYHQGTTTSATISWCFCAILSCFEPYCFGPFWAI